MAPKNQNLILFKELDKIYYNVGEPGSYGGVKRLLDTAKAKGLKVTEKIIKKYLTGQASYSLHKPARKHFTRNPTVVGGIDQQWQADLADMQAIAKDNNGVHYILTVIDIFSKFAWAIPVKNKGSKEMLEAFKNLLVKSKPRKPKKLQTDAGKEFLNSEVQKFLKSEGIHHFVSHSDQKAAVVERFNRTLKSRIWTYFTAKQTNRYVDKLDDFVNSYNNSFHRSIKMKPSEVSPKDEDKIWLTLYGKKQSSRLKQGSDLKPPRIGEKVRINKVKGIFQKGYIPNWSEEHFHIKEEVQKNRPVYHLTDDLGEDIKADFYPEEIQPIEENRYLIEKFLKKKNDPSGKFLYFVKWKGWPSKFNSWITDKLFKKIKKPQK